MFAEVAAHAEPPNNHYERIEPLSNSDSFLNPFSTFKPLDDQYAKRPLPPIPPQELESQTLPVRNNRGWFKKYTGNSQRGSPSWQSRVGGTKSRPLARVGSEPDLLNAANCEQRLSTSHSLECLDIEDTPKKKNSSKSSKSTPEKSFMSLPRRKRPSFDSSAAPGNQGQHFPSDTGTLTSHDEQYSAATLPILPPPPSRPSAEEIVYNFCAAKSKRNSMLRRQRPVSPGMRRRSGNYPPSNPTEPTLGPSQPECRDVEEDSNPTRLVSPWFDFTLFTNRAINQSLS